MGDHHATVGNMDAIQAGLILTGHPLLIRVDTRRRWWWPRPIWYSEAICATCRTRYPCPARATAVRWLATP